MADDEVMCGARGRCELPAGHEGEHAWVHHRAVVTDWNYQHGPKPDHKAPIGIDAGRGSFWGRVARRLRKR